MNSVFHVFDSSAMSSDTAPLVAEHGEQSVRAEAAYDADGVVRVRTRCNWYLGLSILRWSALICVAFALGIAVRGDILTFYRTDYTTVCSRCLAHAQADPAFLYEFGECALKPEFADATKNTKNLLVYNGSFLQTSDLLFQNASLIIAFVFAALLLVIYLVTTLACGPSSNDAEVATNKYSHIALSVNVYASFLAMMLLLFSHSLVLQDACYLRPYPRGLALGFLLTLIVGLFALIIASILPCCVGWKRTVTLVFLVAGTTLIFAAHCTLLALLVYIGRAGAPAWVLPLGVLSFVMAFESVYFSLITRRNLVTAVVYRAHGDAY